MDQFYTAVVHGASVKPGTSSLESFRNAAQACNSAEQWFGSSAEEKAKISSWVSMDVSNKQFLLADMERVLESSSFLCLPNRETAGDLIVYAALNGTKINEATFPNTSRWMNHMQTFVAKATGNMGPLVQFKMEALKPVVFTASPTTAETVKKEGDKKEDKNKKEEKKKDAAAASPAVTTTETPKKEESKKNPKESAPAPAAAATAEEPPTKKKAEKAPAPPAAAAAAASTVFLPLQLDVRVGRIVSCEKHKEADTLYVEQIDLGEESGPRTICSGLVKYYADASMLVNKLVLVVCNLKPRTMVGVESNGMVLAASSLDKSQVELVVVPEGSQVGDKVTYAQYDGPKVEVLAPQQVNKKKVLEGVMPGWKVNEAGSVFWTDGQKTFDLQVQGKTCTGGAIRNGTVG